MRKQIFDLEFPQRAHTLKYDFDKYDLLGDHILLIDSAKEKIIGTYRILCSRFTHDFYSQNEFYIDEFLKEPGVKIELGRACIDPEYRNGSSIAMIWKGLAKFSSVVNAEYMFGCTSISSMNSFLTHAMIAELDKAGHLNLNYNVQVQEDFRCGHIQYLPELLTTANIQKNIPHLLKSYLKAGAKVLAGPAFDQEFQCADFFTALKLSEISDIYKKRYFD